MATWRAAQERAVIKVFYGENRVKALDVARELLGSDYEVLEGGDLTLADLPSVFLGASLLAQQRRILIRDLGVNGDVFERLADYVETEHEVVVLEEKLDKRRAAYKKLQEAGVEIREFIVLPDPNARLVFEIFETALRDGSQAVKMVEKIELTEDPYRFTGLLVTQALKQASWRMGGREKRILRLLGQLDMQMKGESTVEPWLLVKSFLLRVGKD